MYLKKFDMLDFSSPMHLILIILVIVLLFGGKKIPELMKGIGQGMKEFKKASQVEDEPVKKEPETKDTEIKASDKK
jgi:twin arginine-targeting protein translocase, TatA/E family